MDNGKRKLTSRASDSDDESESKIIYDYLLLVY